MKPARRGAGALVARASAAENERRPAPWPRSPPPVLRPPPPALRLPPPPDAPEARPAAACLRAPPSAASHAPFRPGARGAERGAAARTRALGSPEVARGVGEICLLVCLVAIFVSCQLLSQQKCGKANCPSSPRQNKCLVGLAELLLLAKSKELRMKMKEKSLLIVHTRERSRCLYHWNFALQIIYKILLLHAHLRTNTICIQNRTVYKFNGVILGESLKTQYKTFPHSPEMHF
uniref:uncharacterized protein LOC132671368 isoform X1 n=1 Tax=Panthera onca TaxID=9690 RepID=UPI002955D5BF|nr:uncharacterized protein LOC132671368 isoform X1 [Panthera onca]